MNKLLLGVGMLLLLYGVGSTVVAQSSQSPTYELRESYIGIGGSIDSSSPGYRSSDTVGDIGIGNSSSPSYNSSSGFNTTNDPRLSVIVNTSTVNFGALSSAATTTATSTFSVLNYTSQGYSVYTIGSPPAITGHTLSGMSSTGPSQVGVEQYGINLKANTSPITFGSDPVQVPSTSFSYGAASTGYNTADNYRYVAGEKIANAAQSSGQTNYTVAYIINASTSTPAGKYTGTQSLVVVGTY
jgi:hypothetical protein